ncbi:MAG: ABC transporter ATP-binding protein, partial [Candidatus Methanomethylophilaceae archaeon]
DPRGMAEMRDVLKNIGNGRDVTVVMSSHMLHEVSDLCDRVAILNHGKLILDDTIDAITSRSGARQIIIKLDHTPTTDDVAKVAAISGITSASRFGVDIEAKMPSEFARSPDLFKAISDLGIGAYNMYENESLEATYLSLIKESR